MFKANRTTDRQANQRQMDWKHHASTIPGLLGVEYLVLIGTLIVGGQHRELRRVNQLKTLVSCLE